MLQFFPEKTPTNLDKPQTELLGATHPVRPPMGGVCVALSGLREACVCSHSISRVSGRLFLEETGM